MEKRSKSISLVCFGFGLAAKYFVKELLKNKYRINLITTSRSKTVNKKFLNINYKNFYFDNNKFDKKIENDDDLIFPFSCNDIDNEPFTISFITRKKQDNRKQLYINQKDVILVYNIVNFPENNK